MNGAGTFFFSDGGKCSCNHWVDDFFPDSSSGERWFPDGKLCSLKFTDFQDTKGARSRRRWEDGFFYEKIRRKEVGPTKIAQQSGHSSALKLAAPQISRALKVEAAKSARLLNFRGTLILVPDEDQVRIHNVQHTTHEIFWQSCAFSETVCSDSLRALTPRSPS